MSVHMSEDQDAPMGLSPEEYLEWLKHRTRTSLISFLRLFYPEYKANWHHRSIEEEIFKLLGGKSNRLMVLMPPRHGKTLLTTKALSAFFIGHIPGCSVMNAFHSASLASDVGEEIRDNIIKHPLYQLPFPGRALKRGTEAKQDWKVQYEDPETGRILESSYLSFGMEAGAPTGRGADLLIVDDPIRSYRDASSKGKRDTLDGDFRNTVSTRLEGAKLLVVVMTNWHEDDISARILREQKEAKERGDEYYDKWSVLRLSAIATKDEYNTAGKLLRNEGEALWEERVPLKELLATKARMGPGFDAEYQQMAHARKGNIFRRKWWEMYEYGYPPKDYEYIVQSWDTAMKTGEQNDYSVGTVWMVAKKGNYLIDMWRDRVESPELETAIESLYRKWADKYERVRPVLIEDKASGTGVIQRLKKRTRIPIVPVNPNRDKMIRAGDAAPVVRTGNVYLPQGAPFTGTFMDELAAFPDTEHDDIVDSFTQAINFIENPQGSDVKLRWI